MAHGSAKARCAEGPRQADGGYAAPGNQPFRKPGGLRSDRHRNARPYWAEARADRLSRGKGGESRRVSSPVGSSETGRNFGRALACRSEWRARIVRRAIGGAGGLAPRREGGGVGFPAPGHPPAGPPTPAPRGPPAPSPPAAPVPRENPPKSRPSTPLGPHGA